MNFNVIENSYVDWETIHDEFEHDYLNTTLSNEEIRLKYHMTHGEFKEYRDIIKKENNLSKRPFWKSREGTNKYFYKVHSGYIIMKRIKGTQIYFGYVPSATIAEIIVKKCEAARWNVPICKEIVHNWRKYVN